MSPISPVADAARALRLDAWRCYWSAGGPERPVLEVLLRADGVDVPHGLLPRHVHHALHAFTPTEGDREPLSLNGWMHSCILTGLVLACAPSRRAILDQPGGLCFKSQPLGRMVFCAVLLRMPACGLDETTFDAASDLTILLQMSEQDLHARCA